MKNGVMGISLLRSPSAPDPTADMGHHEFSYSFFVEYGQDGISKAIDAGYRVSNPPVRIATNAKLPIEAKTVAGKVVLETVKISENEDGIVLRFYEALGSLGVLDLSHFDASVFKEVYECDMIEENFTTLDGKDLEKLEFQPFKVRSFLFRK